MWSTSYILKSTTKDICNISNMYGGASRLSTESVETTLAYFGEIPDRPAESRIWTSQVWVISSWVLVIDSWVWVIDSGSLNNEWQQESSLVRQVKAHWFEQNQKQQSLVAQVTRLPSLCKGHSLKVGQFTPFKDDWSTIVPLTHTGTWGIAASTCYKRWCHQKALSKIINQLRYTVYKTLFGILVYWV